jgi:hypothetical protein
VQVERCLYAAQLATKPAAGGGSKQAKAAPAVRAKGGSSNKTSSSSNRTPADTEQSGKPAKKRKAEVQM